MSLREYEKLVSKARHKVDESKAPGYPLNLSYATNGQALAAEWQTIRAAVVYRLRLFLSPDYDFEAAMQDPFRAMCDGLFDPSTVFVKKEPHPSRKAVDGRFRCITPVSLVDQLVESALFTEYSLRLSENLFYSGSAVGIGFTNRQMTEFKAWVDHNTQLYGQPVSDDMSGFDAVHTPQSLSATCAVDELCVPGLPDWHLANKRWTLVCAKSISVFGCHLFMKVAEGMINSGSKDTSRRNTLLRLIYSFYLSIISGQKATTAGANGDDGLTWGIKDVSAYIAAAESSGIKVRDVNQSPDGISFCSHWYPTGSSQASLESWAKGVYRMLTKTTSKDDALQFLDECRYNVDEYPRIRELIERRFPEPKHASEEDDAYNSE